VNQTQQKQKYVLQDQNSDFHVFKIRKGTSFPNHLKNENLKYVLVLEYLLF